MRDVKTGRPVNNKDHLVSHIEENYFVPSLLVNAIDEIRVSDISLHVLNAIWANQPQKPGFATDHAKESLTKSLKRYMCRQLGFAA